ncbi:SLAM family member 5 isoform X1 [Sigmodon hispidus]
MMAQYHLWIWFLCLQIWPKAAGRDEDLFVVNGILGESVTFLLNIQEPQKVKNIAWTSESSVALVRQRHPGARPEVIVTQDVYEGRIDVVDGNYDLVLRDLRMEDAGIYKANINKENTPTIMRHYRLFIYRRLEKPKITQNLITFKNNSCNVTLTCSVEKEEKNVTYSWSPLGEKSNVLKIIQTPEDQKLTYTCTAQNPVSNSSDSVTIQKLCSDTPSIHLRSTIWPSGLTVFSLLILILCLLLLFYLYKRRQNRIDLEGNVISNVPSDAAYASVSRKAHLTQSRIYDEIPESKVLSCKEEPMNTIYCSVHPLRN